MKLPGFTSEITLQHMNRENRTISMLSIIKNDDQILALNNIYGIDNLNLSSPNDWSFVKICGPKKCLHVERLGFLHWKSYCTWKDTGKQTPCVGK